MPIPNDRRARRGGPRGRSNSNERGSAASRRKRKLRLIARYPARQLVHFCTPVQRLSDGALYPVHTTISCPVEGKTRCYACGALLDIDTVTVDRIIPGAKGGRYVDENCRPACSPCNTATANHAKK